MDGSLLISGILDPIGGATLRTALEPLARKLGEHDHREREQRLADALVELATGNQPAQIQVTSSVETLLGLVGAPAGEMEFSLPISSKTVERMACDFERDGGPAWLGVDRHRRRALEAGGVSSRQTGSPGTPWALPPAWL